jgi:uridylate kinase
MPIIVFDINQTDNLRKIAEGAPIGTLVET